MKSRLILLSVLAFICLFAHNTASAQLPTSAGAIISPNQPIESGKAPHMEAKKIRDASGEQEYVIIFHTDDDALSGLTDFVIQNKIHNGHFTAIGAVKNATLGWLDLGEKAYRSIPVTQQSEVLSFIGDVAVYKGKSTIHAHAVLSGPSGTSIGGHVWQLVVNPTLEVFLTVDAPVLTKEPDSASGLNLIDVRH